MNRTDRRSWRDATTLRDLGELTAQWMEGTVASQPGYAAGWGPDQETMDLIPTLAAVNRAGFLTDASQPGADEYSCDGLRWQQRAAVEGFADDDMRLVLERAVAGTRLVMAAHAVDDRESQCGVVVTTRAQEPYTSFGGHLSRRAIRRQYRECSRAAVEAIRGCWQVTIVDPEWGRNDVLWPLLERVSVESIGVTR